jgi:hypothetical protein
MTRVLPRRTSRDSSTWTNPTAGRPAECRRTFEDTHFSDIWNDAERSRAAFVRTQIEALMRQIRRAVLNRDLLDRPLAQANAGIGSRTDRNEGKPDVS